MLQVSFQTLLGDGPPFLGEMNKLAELVGQIEVLVQIQLIVLVGVRQEKHYLALNCLYLVQLRQPLYVRWVVLDILHWDSVGLQPLLLDAQSLLVVQV